MTETERARLIREVLKSEDPEVQRFIADMLNYADEWRDPDEWTGESRRTHKKPFYTFREIGLPARLWIGNPKTTEATVLFEVDQYAQIFEGADLTRLRRCPICKAVYWAFPAHMQGCNKAHGNAVAKRKERITPNKQNEGRKK